MKMFLLLTLFASICFGQNNYSVTEIAVVGTGYGLYSPGSMPLDYDEDYGYTLVYRSGDNLFTVESADGINWSESYQIPQVENPRHPSVVRLDSDTFIAIWGDGFSNYFIRYDINNILIERMDNFSGWWVRPQVIETDDEWQINLFSADWSTGVNKNLVTLSTSSSQDNYSETENLIDELGWNETFTYKINSSGNGGFVNAIDNQIMIYSVSDYNILTEADTIVIDEENFPVLDGLINVDWVGLQNSGLTYLISESGMQHIIFDYMMNSENHFSILSLHLRKEYETDDDWSLSIISSSDFSNWVEIDNADFLLGLHSTVSMSSENENILWFVNQKYIDNLIDINVMKSENAGESWDSIISIEEDITNSRGKFIHAPEYSSDDELVFLYQVPEDQGSPVDLTANWILKTCKVSGPNPPTINPIDDQEIEEDTDPFLFVTGTFYGSISDYTLYAYSDTDDFYVIDEPAVFGGGWRFRLTPTQNWFGEATVTLILAENESGLADTTSFQVTVLPVNDSPEPFSFIYPTVTDTISIHTDTDETIQFNWEESVDVDSEVNYITTVTLDYFGDTFSDTYESNEPMVEVSPYEWAVLMTNLELERWTLEYTVQASDEEYTVETEGEFVFQNNTLSVENDITPISFRLHQNYPNPFNPVTALRYDIPKGINVNITIYDMIGRQVKTLINGFQSSGYKSIQWDATNNQGQPVSAGVYLYSIEAGEFRKTKKMILLK